MGCTSGCIKCFLNTVNTLWAIGSILILAVAALYIGNGPTILIAIMFVIGGICLIASILGCCGICQEHVGMTVAYAVFIVIALIIEIGGMIFASNLEGVRKFADEDITKLWKEELVNPGAMDFVQSSYKCCGKNSPNDYVVLGRDYPKSCYPPEYSTDPSLYSTGCTEKAEEAYVTLVRNMLNGSWGNIVFTVLMLALSIYLIIRFRRKQRHYNY